MRQAVTSTKWLDVLPGGDPDHHPWDLEPAVYDYFRVDVDINTVADHIHYSDPIPVGSIIDYFYADSRATFIFWMRNLYLLSLVTEIPTTWLDVQNGHRFWPYPSDAFQKSSARHAPVDYAYDLKRINYRVVGVPRRVAVAYKNFSTTLHSWNVIVRYRKPT